MADTYYAWSEILGGKKTAKPGDKVTQDGLGVSDEDWEYMVNERAVRTTPFPDTSDFPGSPVEHAKAQLEAIAAGGYVDTQYGRVEAPTEEDLKKIEGNSGNSGDKK